MKLEFLGAAHEVTGSCTLLHAAGRHILIDCGMEQGRDIYENSDLPVAPQQVDAVILTHAHIDHSGKLPLLAAQGFSGKIYATEATERLCRIMLMDSAHIQEFEAEWRNRKNKRSGDELYRPMYTSEDAQRALALFASCGYHQKQRIADGVTVEFLDAGHLLGSASAFVTVTEGEETQTLLFSGDIGNVNRPLIRNPEQPHTADVAVIESTYGNRLHGPHPNYAEQLTKVFQETFDRGGNVVIPSFAVGRTQELLYCIRQIKEQGAVHGHEDFPVYVDSPLAVEATHIYGGGMMDYYDAETLALLKRGVNPILFDGLRTAVTSDESRAINSDRTPKVILSASGMCEAGRIRHHLKHNLWRPECTVLFVGYQTEGTLGRSLLNGATEVRLFGEEIQVKAQIRQVEGISGHADRDMLVAWLGGMNPRPHQVFVNHGNDEVCDEFAATVTRELGLPAAAPYPGAVYDLAGGAVRCLDEGNRERIAPKSAGAARSQAVYDRLLAAQRQLAAVIAQNRGLANKELARFADQVQELCNKWSEK